MFGEYPDHIAQRIIDNATEIRICSGEGEKGNSEVYTGKRTLRAIRSRLTREQCNGDRWAYIEVDGQRM